MHIHEHTSRTLGVHQPHAGGQNLLHRGLDGEVDGQLQRLGGFGRIAEAVVEHLLDACGADHFGGVHAFAPEGGTTKDMRGQRAVRVKPHLAVAKQKPRFTDVMHRLDLFGRQHLANPEEFPLTGEILQKILGLHIGENPRKFLCSARGIHHGLRLRIERGGFEIGGQKAALAVDDFGPLRGDFNPCGRGARLGGRRGGQNAHAHADGGKGGEEAEAKHEEAAFGAGAVTVAQAFVAQAQVLAFDRVGVLAAGAGFEDAGKRAERGADHSRSPSVASPSVPSANGWMV